MSRPTGARTLPASAIRGTDGRNAIGVNRSTAEAGIANGGGSRTTRPTNVRVASTAPVQGTPGLLTCALIDPILSAADDIDTAAVAAARSAAVVPVMGCTAEVVANAAELSDVRIAISSDVMAWTTLSEAGFDLNDVIGAMADHEDLVIFVSAN